MPPASRTSRPLLTAIAVMAFAPVAVGVWKFGSPFLGQFFASPILWMSLAPVGLAWLSVRKGYVRMRSGDKVFRDQQPGEFRLHVRFMLGAGAALYVMNAALAWVVMSRPR